MQLSKTFLLSAVLVLALVQTAFASVYSQLHFMKVIEPKDNQDFRAGQKLKVKYSMQPLIDGKYQIVIYIYTEAYINPLLLK